MSLKKWNEKITPPNVKPEPSRNKKLTWDENGIRDENGIGIPIIYKPFMETPKPDMVNHPSHYIKGNIEVLDFILAVTKNLPGDEAVLVGHILRYAARYRDKFNALEDLKKARFYLDKLIEKVEGKE